MTELVRVYCEDGRNVLRTAVARVYDEPFAPFSKPHISRTQQDKERRRARKLGAEGITVDATGVIKPPRKKISHFVMNLPDSAIQFLGALRGILSDQTRDISGTYDSMPIVHCHCFTRELEADKAEADIRQVRST